MISEAAIVINLLTLVAVWMGIGASLSFISFTRDLRIKSKAGHIKDKAFDALLWQNFGVNLQHLLVMVLFIAAELGLIASGMAFDVHQAWIIDEIFGWETALAFIEIIMGFTYYRDAIVRNKTIVKLQRNA